MLSGWSIALAQTVEPLWLSGVFYGLSGGCAMHDMFCIRAQCTSINSGYLLDLSEYPAEIESVGLSLTVMV